MRSLIFLVCIFFAGCAPTYLYLGSKQAELAKIACPIDTKHCSFNYDDKQGKTLNGFFYLDREDGGGYIFKGSAKVDISSHSKEYQKVQRLELTFIFFNGDLVIHEETLVLKGELEKYIKFSLPVESSTDIESSKWVSFRWRLSG